MLWGIAVQGGHLEKEGLTEDLGASDATLRPDAAFAVPWFCIAYLAVAWDSYKEKGPPRARRITSTQVWIGSHASLPAAPRDGLAIVQSNNK